MASSVPSTSVGQPLSRVKRANFAFSCPFQPLNCGLLIALSGSEAVNSFKLTLPPGPTLSPVEAKPSTRDTFTSAFRCRVNSGSTCKSHSTEPTFTPLICSTCALPFQIEPDTPEALTPADPRRDSTTLAGSVTNAKMTNAPTPSAINGHKRFINAF